MTLDLCRFSSVVLVVFLMCYPPEVINSISSSFPDWDYVVNLLFIIGIRYPRFCDQYMHIFPGFFFHHSSWLRSYNRVCLCAGCRFVTYASVRYQHSLCNKCLHTCLPHNRYTLVMASSLPDYSFPVFLVGNIHQAFCVSGSISTLLFLMLHFCLPFIFISCTLLNPGAWGHAFSIVCKMDRRSTGS